MRTVYDKLINNPAFVINVFAWFVVTGGAVVVAAINGYLDTGAWDLTTWLGVLPSKIDALVTVLLGALGIRGVVYTKDSMERIAGKAELRGHEAGELEEKKQ